MVYAKIGGGKFKGFFYEKPEGEYIELTDEEHHELYGKYCVTPCASFELKNGKIVIGNNGEITSPAITKSNLLLEADAIIQPLTGYALAGIMLDADKARFKAWNEYRKALEGVDVTAADIEWPDRPQ